MARVPTYDSLQVEANTLPQPRLNAPNVPDTAGREAMQTGAAVQSASGKLGELAIAMQREINQVRIDDAANRAKEAMLRLTFDKDTGYTMLKGSAALERPDGASLDQEYGDRLQQELDGIAGTLGNDAQRQAFKKLAGGMATLFRGDVLKHATQEYVTYSLSVAEGVQATAMRDIMLNYDNPEAVDKAVLRIRGQTYRQAQLTGKSAEWQEAQNRKLTSEAHKLVVKTALERGNLGYAEGYMSKYKDQLDGDDYLTLQGTFMKERDLRTGTAIGAEIGQSLVAPGGGYSQYVQRRRQLESGGRANARADGSSATGIDQFTAGTFLRVVKRYMPNLAEGKSDEQILSLRTNVNISGRAAVALDQENAAALKKAGVPVTEATLYAAHHFGARAAVAFGRASMDTPMSSILTPDQMRANPYLNGKTKAQTLQNWQRRAGLDGSAAVAIGQQAQQAQQRMPTPANVEQLIASNPTLQANPKMAEYARKEAQRQIKVAQDTQKQQGEEAEMQALQMVMDNGGRFSDLPLSVREAIPADKVSGVMSTAERIAKGDNVTNAYLYNYFTAHPEKLAALTDAQFVALRKELNDSDFKHFAKERAKAQGKESGGKSPRDVDTGALTRATNQWLQLFRVDPTPKDGSKEAAHVAGLRRFVLERATIHQQATGKRMTEAELVQFVHGLLSQNRTAHRWFSTPQVPLGLIKADEISDSDRAHIKAALYRRGNTDPTDEDILHVYRYIATKK